MGHKVNPLGFRLTVTKDWRSRWFAGKERYGDRALEDLKIRRFIRKHGKSAGIERIDIKRFFSNIEVIVQVAKPGVMIGRGGANLQALKGELAAALKKEMRIVIEEVKDPGLSAKLIAEAMAQKIERRIPTRRVMRRTVDEVMAKGVRGVRVQCGGPLSGPSSIGRTEKLSAGAVPTQTLRSRVDYHSATAFTNYGTIGVKVWVHLGESQ